MATYFSIRDKRQKGSEQFVNGTVLTPDVHEMGRWRWTGAEGVAIHFNQAVPLLYVRCRV